LEDKKVGSVVVQPKDGGEWGKRRRGARHNSTPRPLDVLKAIYSRYF
jgi:hypothetical protein